MIQALEQKESPASLEGVGSRERERGREGGEGGEREKHCTLLFLKRKTLPVSASVTFALNKGAPTRSSSKLHNIIQRLMSYR